jgi:hypothetical protein
LRAAPPSPDARAFFYLRESILFRYAWKDGRGGKWRCPDLPRSATCGTRGMRPRPIRAYAAYVLAETPQIRYDLFLASSRPGCGGSHPDKKLLEILSGSNTILLKNTNNVLKKKVVGVYLYRKTYRKDLHGIHALSQAGYLVSQRLESPVKGSDSL